jgi:hypothetical protein
VRREPIVPDPRNEFLDDVPNQLLGDAFLVQPYFRRIGPRHRSGDQRLVESNDDTQPNTRSRATVREANERAKIPFTRIVPAEDLTPQEF